MTSTPLSSFPIFNSYFETGVRAVVILHEMFPRSFDLERMLALDHLVVHTADIGGPDSLHPSTSTHGAEVLVRRELVQNGLLLMQRKMLIERIANRNGVYYRAGAESAAFVAVLSSQYNQSLKSAAQYLASSLGDVAEGQIDQLIERQLERWTVQFQISN